MVVSHTALTLYIMLFIYHSTPQIPCKHDKKKQHSHIFTYIKVFFISEEEPYIFFTLQSPVVIWGDFSFLSIYSDFMKKQLSEVSQQWKCIL